MASHTVSPEEVLRKNRVVAVVGASKTPGKEAFAVPLYLMKNGYAIVPVNPTADAIHGARAFPSLAEIPLETARSVEIVEVFRPSEELADVARQVVEMKKRTGRTPVFWAQLGLESEEAKRFLEQNAVPYVMNLCMRTEHQRTLGTG